MPDDFWSMILRQTWQISLLIPVVVLSLRLIPRRWPHLHHAILLAVLLKCLIPPVWASPWGVFSWVVPRETQQISGPDDDETPLVLAPIVEVLSGFLPEPWTDSPSEAAPPATDSISRMSPDEPDSWQFLRFSVPWIWGAGCLVLAGYCFGKSRQLKRFHEETESAPSNELQALAESIAARLKLRQAPRLLITTHSVVPFAAGIFRSRVVLPEDIVAVASPEELRLIIAHEVTHLRRGDLIVSALQNLVQLVWWFHPLVWLLNRELRRVRELCVDADVMMYSGCKRRDYADCLLRILELRLALHERPGLAAMSPFEVTTQRLRHVMNFREVDHSHRRGIRAVVFLVAAGTIFPGAAWLEDATAASRIPPPDGISETAQVVGISDRVEGEPAARETVATDAENPQRVAFDRVLYAVSVVTGVAPRLTRHQATMEFQLFPLGTSEQVVPMGPDFGESVMPSIPMTSSFGPWSSGPEFPSMVGRIRPGLVSAPPPIRIRFMNRGVRPPGSIGPNFPGILGDPTELIFPALTGPVMPGGNYTNQNSGTVRVDESSELDDGTTSIVSREIPAEFRSEIQTGETTSSRLLLTRNWTVSTTNDENFSGSPLATLHGEIEIDLNRLVPRRATYRGEYARSGSPSGVMAPVEFEARLISPVESRSVETFGNR